MTSQERSLRSAERHLARSCPHMQEVIRVVGPCELQTQPDGFRMLVRSVTAQQISGTAARAIGGRLEALVGADGISASSLRACDEEQLRTVGYSGRKASYLLALSDAVLDGGLDLAGMDRLEDEEVIRQLTQVRGIGVWTAKMYLIFCLGRPDVLPHEDLGVRQALRRFHALEALPDKCRSIELARPWRPYASVASWYCWRSLDPKFGAEGQ